ncbi:ABC transporter substrate-binding protein [Streptomyces sp. NPDC058001]|uniref:ABC transporter substrate-binding protein n=1 Tax=Streptomyces sp. NPDC058001 TaxID=3346300 RepID=UPI0036E2B6B0
MSRRPGRRAALASAAATGLALTAGGCGGGRDNGAEQRPARAPGKKITLSFWSWVPGIGRSVDLWNRQNPDVRVELEKVSAVGGAQYAKMRAAVKAGRPPDLGQIEYSVVPSFLLDQGLTHLTRYGAARDRGRFEGWLWQQSVYAGAVYAVPQDSGPMGLFVRQDLFDAWEVPVPATWDAYESAARAIRKRGAWIETFAATNGNRFAAYAWQAGARWIRTEGDTWIVSLDDEPTRRVADFWENLVRGKLVKTVPDRQNEWYKDIQSGAMTSWLGASWGDALLAGNAPKTAGKWRVAPLPQWSARANAGANWGGSSTAVFAACRYPRDALAFALWLNADPASVRLLIEGGIGFPGAPGAYPPAALESRRDFFGGQDYAAVFRKSAAAVDTSWRWGPATDLLYQQLGDALTAALDGDGTFRDALRTVQRQTVTDLRAKGLKADTA